MDIITNIQGVISTLEGMDFKGRDCIKVIAILKTLQEIQNKLREEDTNVKA